MNVRRASQPTHMASLLVDDDGKLIVTTASGGTGGATEAKQDTQIGLLTTIESNQDAQTAILTDIESNQGTQSTQLTSIDEKLGREKDDQGAFLPENFEGLAQVLAYTGANVTSIATTNGINTWTQTFGYTGANLTSISVWVRT